MSKGFKGTDDANVEELDRILPVDYSFKKLANLKGLTSNTKPRGGRVKSIPNKGPSNRFITAGVWLNNNNLQTTEHLSEMIENTIEYPQRLAWLDLSFNKIDTVTADIAKFPNLKILYLHGNNIVDMQGIMLLRPLNVLRTITLHGNPIELIPSYRSYIVKILTNLVNLDFTTISPRERDAPIPPGLTEVLQVGDGGPMKAKKLVTPKATKTSKDETVEKGNVNEKENEEKE